MRNCGPERPSNSPHVAQQIRADVEQQEPQITGVDGSGQILQKGGHRVRHKVPPWNMMPFFMHELSTGALSLQAEQIGMAITPLPHCLRGDLAAQIL